MFVRAVVGRTWLLCAAAVASSPPESRPASQPTAIHPGYSTRTEHDPNGIGKFYMGREIAQVMGHEAADWLDRPERDQEEHARDLLKLLQVRPGDVVADIGAGSGFHSLPLARMVGPTGRVEAVDIQQEMLDIIGERCDKAAVKNIDLVLGAPDDPKLPPRSVDLVLMVDVYHEFDQPYEMMRNIVQATKPGGRIVFVEFRREDPKVPIKLLHKMSEAQVLKEMVPQGLKHKETIASLPWQHVIVFERPLATSQPASAPHP